MLNYQRVLPGLLGEYELTHQYVTRRGFSPPAPPAVFFFHCSLCPYLGLSKHRDAPKVNML